MKYFILIVLIFTLSSCATILLRREHKIEVTSNLPGAKVEILDSTYLLPAEFRIKRSKKDLHVKLYNDSLQKDFIVKASPNGTFLYLNLIAYPIFPIMYGIDFTNQKRFYYGKKVFLDINDTNKIIRPKILNHYYNYWHKEYQTNKGQMDLIISFPWVNSFFMQPNGETYKVNTGFWGFSSGLEYFYKDYKYLSFSSGALMDFFIPFPAAVDFSGYRENMYSLYATLTDNFKLKRFTLGYGLTFSKNTWELMYYDCFDPPPMTREPVTKSSNSIGFTFDGYHQIGKLFYIGLIYRPTIVNVYPELKWKYEHIISLNFKMKLRIKK